MSDQGELARRFRDLHGNGTIIVLPNVFDAASAKLAARRRPVALGTTSAGICWSVGYADGDRMPRAEMLAVVARIVGSVEVGVTVDVEGGYGDSPGEIADTVGLVIEAGGIGINIEDAARQAAARDPLLPVEVFAANIAAAREVADSAGIALTINARTDVFLANAANDESDRIALAVDRGNRYLEAGADCVFVPGAVGRATLAALVSGIRGPVSALALPGLPSVPELQEMGIARVSVGAAPAQASLALLDRIYEELLGNGTYELMLSRPLPFADAQQLVLTR
jgi:2-methylisocitrate lyase-like PEP mutase family enzyme